jgi:cyclohexa-1,5-dienecarbonyl-CoA hydratase
VTEPRIASHAQGGLGRVTIGTGPLNILNADDLRALTTALERLDACAVIVLEARGERAFSAGVEIADHVPDRAPAMLDAFGAMATAFRNASPVIVCAVDAPALGGGFELVMLCDLVICSNRVFFALPEVQLAALPPIACALLPNIVGERRAFDAIVSGKHIDAATALAWGLVREVVPSAEIAERVSAICSRLLSYSRGALLACKRAMRGGSIACAMDIYRDELLPTADAAEGINAFLEKRAPIWETSL